MSCSTLCLLTLLGFVQAAPLDEAKRFEQTGQMAEAISVLAVERASDIESGRYLAWLYGQADHSGNHWLRVRLIGRGGNRDAIGARVTLDGKFREMRSGGSYLSHNDTRLGFGPGSAETASHLEGRWPGGKSESFESIKNVGADKTLTLVEGLGIVSISP